MQPFDQITDYLGDGGPTRLVLVGPPGTGKTRAALDSFILPALQRFDPDKVLACSFSNAAADELRSRLAVALKVSDNRLRETCSTIHSEALRRYKRYGDPNPRLYDPLTGTSKPLKKGSEPPETPEHTTPSALRGQAAAAWDYIRAAMAHNEPRYAGWCNRFARHPFTANELLAVIEQFEREKGEQNAIDFTDMLLRALNYEGRELELLLIDEANDCTPLQWALIDHWSKYARRVVVLGDPDQCIHSWCGASYKQLISRVRSPEWNVCVLAQSWRVPLKPHGLARTIVSLIKDREDAEYAPAPRDGSIETCGQDDVLREAEAVAAEYVNAQEKLVGDNYVADKTREMFILCRTNRDVMRLRKALNLAGVPYASEEPGEPRSFAPSSARRARALLDLFDGKSVEVGVAKDALREVPAKGWFEGTKTKALDSLPETGQVSFAGLPWFKQGTSKAALLDAAKFAGGGDYWIRVADKYGAWVLTDPPPIRVMTMHASKGREADVVAVCAEKSPAALFNGVDDDELRVLYVAVTRTKDKLLLFARGGFEVYDELFAEQEAAPF